LLAREVHPGASLDLLPPAPLPDDLAWAHGDPIIAGAYGRAAAFDAVGREALPKPVRNLVTAQLTAWRGEEPGLSRGWADYAIQTLPAPQRPQGRLALLAALASYQVDAHVLDDARTCPGPAGDETLVATAAWASFAAARRIGAWLHTAPAATPAAHRRLWRGRGGGRGEERGWRGRPRGAARPPPGSLPPPGSACSAGAGPPQQATARTWSISGWTSVTMLRSATASVMCCARRGGSMSWSTTPATWAAGGSGGVPAAGRQRRSGPNTSAWPG